MKGVFEATYFNDITLSQASVSFLSYLPKEKYTNIFFARWE